MARKMRDSGVEWIGEVPEGWEVNLIGTFYSQRSEKVSDTDYAPLSVTMKGVLPQLATVAKTDDGDNRKLVKKGDFAINSRSDRRGSCGISEYDGSVSLINTILMPRGEMDPRYYNWLFHTEAFADEFYKWGHGIVDDLWTTRWSEMKRIQIVAPPLPEQRRIADYLDGKCAAINMAVDELKRGIEDCKAWKKAIITEVTSVGLDHDVKLLQTELGWISNRPSYWKRNQLSSLCHRGITYGIVKLGEPCENGVKVLRCSDVKDGYLDASNVRTVTPELSDEYKRTVLSGGEVIVNVRGTLGGCAIVPKEFSGANIAREVALLDVEESKANPKFIMYTLLSSCFANYVGHEMAGAIYQGLNIATLSKYSFYAPDIKEQQAIADYLDEKCAAIDALVAEKEKFIVDLEAYKKSIIFELVTGKREVA